MAYNQNIPQPPNRLKDSQSQLLENFSQIYNVFGINHVNFNEIGAGKHNLVTFPEQSVAPVFAAGEEGLYNLPYNNQTNTKNELFVHKQLSTGTADIPFTSSILSQTNPASGANGWTYLPSGILLRWETPTISPGLQTVTLSAGYPAFNAIFSILLTPINGSAGDEDFAFRLVNIISTTQFSVYLSKRTSVGPASISRAVKVLIIGR